MGQCYRATVQENGKMRSYSPHNCIRNGEKVEEFYGWKLMEHSWYPNEFVNGVCKQLESHPMCVAWVGDYALDSDQVTDDDVLQDMVKKAWNDEFLKPLEIYPFDREANGTNYPCYLDGKYLVDHTEGWYLDCDKYRKRSADKDGWCVHPLPLLTAVGNGLGGGDYYKKSSDAYCVGSWAWDEISIERAIPEGYLEYEVTFYEEF
jgi:hypothetical protein